MLPSALLCLWTPSSAPLRGGRERMCALTPPPPRPPRAAPRTECMLLAKAYCKLGDRAEAQFYLQQAAQLARTEPFFDASTNALLYSIVAELYLMQGDAANAELMYTQFCVRMERLYGTEHVATSDCYNLIAAFYTHQADYARAIEFCGRALVIRIEKLGPTHRECACYWPWA